MISTDIKFGEFATFKYGKMPIKTKIKEVGQYPIFSGYRNVGYYDEFNVQKGQLVIVARGVGGTGDVKLTEEPCFLTNLSIAADIDCRIASPKFLYYYFSQKGLRYLDSGSAQSQITISDLEKVIIQLPPLEDQLRIESCLGVLDDKIRENETINHNLEQQVLALYRQMFVDSPNDNRKICRADEYFDISIGKTPPRKEHEWFKIVRADNIVWVSIADMGNCGLFIGDSSEYLTPSAVKKFNVVTVPDNTVLLSFKLTVGRIAITDGQMTTNEAIAHFKTDNKIITEYLYCYLKSYNFQTLGSTSSIATAVNSKIIKAMPFVVPTDAELSAFHDFAAPAFGKIKACQHENTRLAELRNSLLPKLMSGEIDVSNIKL